MTAYHLAQVNVALAKAPLDSPRLRSFVELLEPVNALADRSPGFVWRLQTEDGNATAVRAFPDDDHEGRLIVNLTVWESFEALADYVYCSAHLEVMRRRREWFARTAKAHLALWWVPAGTRPTVADAEERVAVLRAQGPTPYAFTFRDRFPPPPAVPERRQDERWGGRRPPRLSPDPAHHDPCCTPTRPAPLRRPGAVRPGPCASAPSPTPPPARARLGPRPDDRRGQRAGSGHSSTPKGMVARRARASSPT